MFYLFIYFFCYTVTEASVVKRRNEEPDDGLVLFSTAPAKRRRNRDLELFFYSNGTSSRVERRKQKQKKIKRPLLTARIVKGRSDGPDDRLVLFFMAPAKRRRNKDLEFFFIQ